MRGTDDSAAHASNWRTVLVVDGTLGMLVSVAGLVLAFAVNPVAGAAAAAVGAGYTALVGARARRWARLRREAPGGPG
jgi:hypothetical protein